MLCSLELLFVWNNLEPEWFVTKSVILISLDNDDYSNIVDW